MASLLRPFTPAGAAGDEIAERRLHHLEAVARPLVEAQVDRAHAARDVDHHRDRDALALDPGGLDAPLRPGEREHRETQVERAQPRQRRVQPGGERRPQAREIVAHRKADRASCGPPPHHDEQHGQQQQNQQRLGMSEPHWMQAPPFGAPPNATPSRTIADPAGRSWWPKTRRMRSPLALVHAVNRSTRRSLTRLSAPRAHAITGGGRMGGAGA